MLLLLLMMLWKLSSKLVLLLLLRLGRLTIDCSTREGVRNWRKRVRQKTLGVLNISVTGMRTNTTV